MNSLKEIVNKPENKGFFKRIGLLAGASALFFLVGCAQQLIQYRARVQTKPPAEANIYLNGELKGRTSKKEPVYVESAEFPVDSQCTLSLQRNKYKAHLIMHYLNDIKGTEFEQAVTLNSEGRSENCLEAKVTKWEKGPSYDMVFEIPRNMILEIYKPETQTPKKEAASIKKSEESIPKKSEINADIEKFLDDSKPIEFFATINVGSSFPGVGMLGGILYNFERKYCVEVSIGFGYWEHTEKDYSGFNRTYSLGGSVALHFKYFRDWSGYLKLLGGIENKTASGTTNDWGYWSYKPKSGSLPYLGLCLGHRWFYKDFFLFTDIGCKLVDKSNWHKSNWQDYKPKLTETLNIIFDMGIGMKF